MAGEHVPVLLYSELKQNEEVDLATNWYAWVQYNRNGFGLLRYAIGTMVPLRVECGFLKITK